MNIDKDKLLKALFALAALFIVVIGMTKLIGKNSLTLTEYAEQHPELANSNKEETTNDEAERDETAASDTGSLSESHAEADITDESLQNNQEATTVSTLTGAVLNANSMEEMRVSYTESFYYEPLSDNLKRYITGVSYPAASLPVTYFTAEGDVSDTSEYNTAPSLTNDTDELAISYEELRYVHILHYDFNGNLTEGELICNEYIAQDLVEIFYELYRNEYQLESVRLIDEYDGDDTASMEDNNTSCFNYRLVEGSTSLSKHALGLAIDVNPLYNPYITYNADGSENVSPTNASDYADRSMSFPYKIDENDLCYKLFTEHGFTWGGNWNSCKDYQHFQKVIPK